CTEPKLDPNACQQGYAFGAYGCTEVTGSVLNAGNQPIANAYVSAGSSTDPFDANHASTDATGKFTMRLQRRWMMNTPSSDTSTAWVHAVTPAPPASATADDSVQVLLNYVPIGMRPTASVITIHLNVP
ncbi:MAG TPA: hypothetical protein VF483_13365, partial [Gemmatimonadaceae bacterium]